MTPDFRARVAAHVAEGRRLAEELARSIAAEEQTADALVRRSLDAGASGRHETAEALDATGDAAEERLVGMRALQAALTEAHEAVAAEAGRHASHE